MLLIGRNFARERLPRVECQMCDGDEEHVFAFVATKCEPADDPTFIAGIVDARDGTPFGRIDLRGSLPDDGLQRRRQRRDLAATFLSIWGRAVPPVADCRSWSASPNLFMSPINSPDSPMAREALDSALAGLSGEVRSIELRARDAGKG